MSDDTAKPESSESASPADIQSVYLVSYPKVTLLWPTFLLALISGVCTLFAGDLAPAVGMDGPPAAQETSSDVEGEETVDDETPAAKPVQRKGNRFAEFLGVLFLGVFGLNLVVLAFDFPRTASLTLLFLIFGVLMGALLLFRTNPDLLPAITDILQFVKPIANADFYFLFFGILCLIFICVFLSVQFDYWEVRPNELLHHHGFLSNLKRYPTRNLRVEKEITDVFEYALLGSGRLILYPEDERRAIVLDNVPAIGRKEQQITKLLGAMQVQIRTAP
ncbi:hypothetical protein [Stratiformator vulcanicus]|uniref:Uncharacterized protein n=1 Tax=Stratiformator vulcanicus TaxID=2527980 RepID=A0A517QZN6_9PLAN|nr:hypothetical protein [Stratiformator vulcanicus]QDT37099.1 hypothetical protein Pan189_14670 [Stratiformator vulcanicus]